ncbi:hypothetical protein C9374_008159 [Naegleria lovaniensis]|uniref:Cap-specific mRNA (nucleoside-2'-O-)-methyltransferase n=1 Tax=Naegleria lovaniensis TaxID=51637 RepID=A0AA88KGC6_NAELO|nr:uncharacterized protein C9374_008159 [Naegleria lovaniensis]KAG2378520.1 hypothetical protein C9374_008159 [Naegleria lovaniensis]
MPYYSQEDPYYPKLNRYNNNNNNNQTTVEPSSRTHYSNYDRNYANRDKTKVYYRKVVYENYVWPDRRENSHCEQILHYHDPVIEDDVVFDRTLRILQDNAPREPYRRRRDELKSVIHWGQRKLLMSEIEFLTEFGFPGATVVYAGAAPGNHTNFLSEMFPDLFFVLVDPSPFVCRPTDKIKIINDYFTDDLAKEYSGKNVLFISDIRTAEPQRMSEDEVEKCVAWDNQAQMNWHHLLKPKMSMLKFRLPYKSDITPFMEYLDGEIYLPVWGPQTTSETRLICKGGCGTKIYDTQMYQDQMFFFNTRTRVYYYPHDVDAVGMDHCYDCRSEVYILELFLKRYNMVEYGTETDEKRRREILNKSVAEWSEKISKVISSKNVTLATYEKVPIVSQRPKELHKIYETDKIRVSKETKDNPKKRRNDDVYNSDIIHTEYDIASDAITQTEKKKK